jgi:PAS domain S-box-containing protein
VVASLRVRLLFLVALALLPIVALGIYNAAEQRRDAAGDVKREALRLARLCAANHEEVIESARQLLITLAQTSAVQAHDAQASNLLFASVLTNFPIYANIGAILPDGTLFASALPAAENMNLRDRAYFRRAMETREFAAGDFETGRITHRRTLNVAYPITKDEKVLEVLYAAVDLNWINGVAARIELPPNAVLTLLDQDGIIRARVPDGEKLVGQSAADSQLGKSILHARAEGAVEAPGVDNVKRLYAFTRIAAKGSNKRLLVTVGIPKEIAFHDQRETTRRQAVLLLLTAVLGFGGAWLVADFLVLRRVKELVKATRRITAGDLRARVAGADDRGELGQLAQLFNEMAESHDRRVAERNQTEQALRRAREELEARVEQRTQNLEASERRTRLIIETAYDAFVAMDAEGKIMEWNPQAEKIFGWPRNEVLGRAVTGLIIPERFREQYQRTLRRSLRTDEGAQLSGRWEIHMMHRDGHEFPVEMTVTPMRWKESYIFNAFIHDITRRVVAKEALEETARELRRSNEELEQFAYVASHDLQEPLRMVASYTQLLQRRYADKLDATANEFIAFAVDGAKRMQQFILDLLHYSRVGTKARPFEPVELDKVFATVVTNLKVAIEERHASVIADALPVVTGDFGQLVQVFQKLIGNAIKFRKPNEAPRVHISAQRENSCWQIAIADNGIGIEPQFFERIFVIFQRLHRRTEYSGTGLGLAICKKIIEAHKGRIWVESEPGKGSTFFLTLPAAT